MTCFFFFILIIFNPRLCRNSYFGPNSTGVSFSKIKCIIFDPLGGWGGYSRSLSDEEKHDAVMTLPVVFHEHHTMIFKMKFF